MQTKPPLINYFVGFFSIAMLSIVGSLFLTVGIVYMSDSLFDFSLDIYKTTIWLCIGLVLFLIMLRDLKKPYDIWSLNNNVLTKGKTGDIAFDLNKIEYIVFGLPQGKLISFLQKILFLSDKGIGYASILTIKFNDNTYLLFSMNEIEGGIDLANKILANHQDKIIDDYIFTEEERKILKIKMSNRLLKTT